MERKTIGGFISTLRKANGMTQRELAEKLNVSDKTISRWERDDGAPDLSAIPVIAEIFGVTCDELLRGERKPMAEWMKSRPEQTDAEGVDGLQKQNDGKCDGTGGITPANQKLTLKGEKQCQRILAVGLAKYKTKTFIAMGISSLGLIAAMIDESFVAFMEQDIPYSDYAYSSSNARENEESAVAPIGEITYYDEQGNVISEEEALHRELTDSKGNVVCEYMERNETVASIRYSDKDGKLLPITVITYADMRGGQATMSLINSAFVVGYFLEVIVGIWIYFRKRVK